MNNTNTNLRRWILTDESRRYFFDPISLDKINNESCIFLTNSAFCVLLRTKLSLLTALKRTSLLEYTRGFDKKSFNASWLSNH